MVKTTDLSNTELKRHKSKTLYNRVPFIKVYLTTLVNILLILVYMWIYCMTKPPQSFKNDSFFPNRAIQVIWRNCFFYIAIYIAEK